MAKTQNITQDEINKSIGEALWHDFTHEIGNGKSGDDAAKAANKKNVERNKKAQSSKGFFARWGKQ